MRGVVSQTRASGMNRNHDPHTNSLAHYCTLKYQGTPFMLIRYSLLRSSNQQTMEKAGQFFGENLINRICI